MNVPNAARRTARVACLCAPRLPACSAQAGRQALRAGALAWLVLSSAGSLASGASDVSPLAARMSIPSRDRGAPLDPSGTEGEGDRPSNVKRYGSIGERSSLPRGWFVYLEGNGGGRVTNRRGILISSLSGFEPRPVPNTSGAERVEISDDGRWLLCEGECEDGYGYLIRPDGSGRTVVPFPRKRPNNFRAGWLRRGPLGAEVFYQSARRVKAIRVDLSGEVPSFGGERVVADFNPDGKWFAAQWGRDLDVAGNHIFGCTHTVDFYTIPDGGSGVAGKRDRWQYGRAATFYCGHAMSHDGKIVAFNAARYTKSKAKNAVYREYVPWRHRGPVILPFKEADEPRGAFVGELILEQGLSLNWAPERYCSRGNDWHSYYFSNDNEYLVCRLVGRGARGVWLLHWPTNTWTLLTAPATPGMRPAVHILGRENTRFASERAGNGEAAPADRALRQAQDAAVVSLSNGDRAGTCATRGSGASAAASLPAVEDAAETAAEADSPRITIEATITDVSGAPAITQIGAYSNVLTFIRYRVEEVREGQLDDGFVIIAHYCVKDRKHTAAAAYSPGQRQLVTCDPFDEHAELKATQQMNDIDDFDSKVYWALDVRPAKTGVPGLSVAAARPSQPELPSCYVAKLPSRAPAAE